MYKKFIGAFQLLNLLFQSLYSLAMPIGLGALAAYLLTKYASFPGFTWAILMVLGTMIGLCSMVKFILTASESLVRLERQRERTEAEKEAKEAMQARLRKISKTEKGDDNDTDKQ